MKQYIESLTNYKRNKTVEVSIGSVKIGGNNPIKVQTMCNTSTKDVESTVRQIVGVAHNTNCDIIRVTVPTMNDVESLRQIHTKVRAEGVAIPIVADVHFNAEIAFECAKIVEKVRVNPGNFGHHSLPCLTEDEYIAEGKLLEDTFRKFLNICRQYHTAVRIGTNHGSLSKRILNRYGDTPEGMVESVMEFLRVAQNEKFYNVAVSLKSSNPTVAIRTARLMVKAMKDENMNYCLHLGVTEAGEGDDGRIKSASGICPLLSDGIGDTIRVSLTEEPENEILPAQEIVAYKDYISQATPLPEIPWFYDAYHYHKRKSTAVGRIGGDNLAVVAVSVKSDDDYKSLIQGANVLAENSKIPDIAILGNNVASNSCQLGGGIIVGIDSKQSDNNHVEIAYINEYSDYANLNIDSNVVLIAEPTNRNKIAAFRLIFCQLLHYNINNPVLLKPDGGECDKRFESFASAAECAGVFIDGFGDGVCLDSNNNPIAAIELAFKILQISRLRMTATEYVSCPGCGRTLYDLQGTVKRIKEATRKYNHLKIAVMGCIVNGPGEMADADFGYVGAGKGKIALYKGGEVVKRDIPEEKAVDELINLIETSY